MEKFDFLENKKSFFDEIKSIFHSFWRAIIWWKNKSLVKIADTSLKYKAKIIAKNEARPTRPPFATKGGDQLPQPPAPQLKTEVAIPFKHLSNFWRSFDLHLINCKVELYLSWKRYCVLSDFDVDLSSATCLVNGTNVYVPVATVSIINNIVFRTFNTRIQKNSFFE